MYPGGITCAYLKQTSRPNSSLETGSEKAESSAPPAKSAKTKIVIKQHTLHPLNASRHIYVHSSPTWRHLEKHEGSGAFTSTIGSSFSSSYFSCSEGTSKVYPGGKGGFTCIGFPTGYITTGPTGTMMGGPAGTAIGGPATTAIGAPAGAIIGGPTTYICYGRGYWPGTI